MHTAFSHTYNRTNEVHKNLTKNYMIVLIANSITGVETGVVEHNGDTTTGQNSFNLDTFR